MATNLKWASGIRLIRDTWIISEQNSSWNTDSNKATQTGVLQHFGDHFGTQTHSCHPTAAFKQRFGGKVGRGRLSGHQAAYHIIPLMNYLRQHTTALIAPIRETKNDKQIPYGCLCL